MSHFLLKVNKIVSPFLFTFLVFVTLILYQIILYAQIFDINTNNDINMYRPSENETSLQITTNVMYQNAHCWDLQKRQRPLHDSYATQYTSNDGQYPFNKIPKGTFTFWLSHIESRNRINDKSYFADKYLMKQYIKNYTEIYSRFDYVNYARIIYDFTDKNNPP